MAKLHALGQADWPQVWRLMLLENFPHVPDNLSDAEVHFQTVKLYGLQDEKGLALVIVMGQKEEGHFLDIVCRKDIRGKWASKGLLKQIHYIAFTVHNAQLLFVESYGKTALKTALKAGFSPVHLGEKSVLVMQNSA